MPRRWRMYKISSTFVQKSSMPAQECLGGADIVVEAQASRPTPTLRIRFAHISCIWATLETSSTAVRSARRLASGWSASFRTTRSCLTCHPTLFSARRLWWAHPCYGWASWNRTISWPRLRSKISSLPSTSIISTVEADSRQTSCWLRECVRQTPWPLPRHMRGRFV